MFVSVDTDDGCSVPELCLESEAAGKGKGGVDMAASQNSACSPQKDQAEKMESCSFPFYH